MRMSGKLRIVSIILVVVMVISCIPSTTFAYDVHAKIKNFANSQVKKSNQIVDSNKKTIDQFVNKGIEIIGKKAYDSFALFEEKTGVDKQNWLYAKNKNNILEVVGLGLGVIKGAKNIGLDIYSIGAKVPTLPERTISLAYSYADNPKLYQNRVSNGAKSAVGMLANPVPYLSAAYNYGKNTYIEAKKDPLKYGMLLGEATTYGVSLVTGGAQIKALAEAQKIKRAQKATVVLSPYEIRHCQSSVNGAQEIINSMKAKGWLGDAIDVVKMSDGKLTSVDNTRILAAKQAGINVKARVHAGTDPLPPEFAVRFKSKKGLIPDTWEDAVLNRISKQNSAYRKNNPTGSYITGWDGN